MADFSMVVVGKGWGELAFLKSGPSQERADITTLLWTAKIFPGLCYERSAKPQQVSDKDPE
jgi:hypothetical protein